MSDCLYRFRIFPDKAQEEQIINTFNACKYLYGYFFELEKEIYIGSRIFLNTKERLKILTELKKEEEHAWLKKFDASTLKFVIKNISEEGFTPENRLRCRESYTISNKGNIKILKDENCVQIPKLGKLRCKLPKNIEGEIMTVTVEKTSLGQYYIGIYCHNFKENRKLNQWFVDI